jgi:hypothetical protein
VFGNGTVHAPLSMQRMADQSRYRDEQEAKACVGLFRVIADVKAITFFQITIWFACGHLDLEFQCFLVDASRVPKRISQTHFSDETRISLATAGRPSRCRPQ